MKKFENGDFRVETIISERNEILFKAKDVAYCLGYKNTDEAVRRHVSEKYKVRISNHRVGGHSIFIKEPGLYELLFSSKLPPVKFFRNWVFEEVLPSI